MREDFIVAINKLEQKDRAFLQEFLSFIEELGFSTSGICDKQIENWVDLVKPELDYTPPQRKEYRGKGNAR